MYLVAGGQDTLQRLHFVHHRCSQAQLVGALLRGNGQVDGVQPVDTIITLRGSLGMSHTDQLVQTKQLALGGCHRDGRCIETRGTAFGHQGQTNPTASPTVGAYVIRPQKFTAVMILHGPVYVVYRDSQTTQLLTVILQLPLHGGSACHFHLVHTVQTGQAGTDVLLSIPLDEDGCRRSIQGEGQERPLGLLVGHLHLYHRIGDPVGQFRPGLAHDGGCFETHRIHIRILVQVDRYAPPAVAGCRTDLLHPADARQHGFQLAGDLHLHHTRRGILHGITDRETRQAARGIEFDRQLGHQGQAHQSQANETDDEGER